LRNARLPQGRPNAIAWDPATERVLAATGDGTLRLFDGATGTLLRAFTEEDNLADYLAIYPGGRFAFSASRTGQIKLWDLEAGLSRAQIIITQHGWAVMDSLGRFDGSDDGLADISWQAARLAVPIDRFERYREPGLLARILIDAISFDRPAVAPVQNGIVPPPTVTFTSARHEAGWPTAWSVSLRMPKIAAAACPPSFFSVTAVSLRTPPHLRAAAYAHWMPILSWLYCPGKTALEPWQLTDLGWRVSQPPRWSAYRTRAARGCCTSFPLRLIATGTARSGHLASA
jgi:hypothetical protein